MVLLHRYVYQTYTNTANAHGSTKNGLTDANLIPFDQGQACHNYYSEQQSLQMYGHGPWFQW